MSKRKKSASAENTVKTEFAAKTDTPAAERIFALDIGTRSVIGIVAEITEDKETKILATVRKEHKTRAMLDGQIHDVPEVAAIIGEVKEELEAKTGKIKNAAVAAAGRALYTMRAEAELQVSGVIDEEMEQNLDFAGVQAAQNKLAESRAIDDPAGYYCVGYSTIEYMLDEVPLKSLVGQRGNTAKVSVVATFLPRQVIDSMHSALGEASLNMSALTLEPIAAINVLIPQTMRHLNLALVDIGAGTSDVALTKNGAVFAYGMVPLAGDEITEAVSQKFLLDFKVAEEIKRKATKGERVEFSDILGVNYNLSADEVITPILPSVKNLADAIAKEITTLNGGAPQAVMLVGGGALTPNLAPIVAGALNMTEDRVAVRRPEKVEGILELPEELKTSDSVTPLGILKIATTSTLHFLSVFVNGEEYSLFNFRRLTVSDALLNAGIRLPKFNGRPGLAIMVTLNGEKKFFPGTMGGLATIKLNGETKTLDSRVKDGDKIEIVRGKDGEDAKATLRNIITKEDKHIVRVNGKEIEIETTYIVNGKVQPPDTPLKDGDNIEKRDYALLGEILKRADYSPVGERINYTLNGNKSHFTTRPEILLNGKPTELSAKVRGGDVIKYNANDKPTIKDALDIDENAATIKIVYEGRDRRIPAANVELSVNGKAATSKTVIEQGAAIVYKQNPRAKTTVSDALLAVNFTPPAATSRMKFDILVNGKSAEFVDPMKNGDTLEVILTKIGERKPVKTAPEKENLQVAKFEDKANLSEKVKEADEAMVVKSDTQTEKDKEKTSSYVPNIPGLREALEASRK
ncbi:MAG: cell division protein [Selenomonadaceae bacterium]|nr:cell division protein [Selenomonadaceae bacterium]